MPYLIDCVFYMPFSQYHNSLLKLSTLSLMLMDSFVSLSYEITNLWKFLTIDVFWGVSGGSLKKGHLKYTQNLGRWVDLGLGLKLLRNNIIHHKTWVVTFVDFVCSNHFSNEASALFAKQ